MENAMPANRALPTEEQSLDISQASTDNSASHDLKRPNFVPTDLLQRGHSAFKSLVKNIDTADGSTPDLASGAALGEALARGLKALTLLFGDCFLGLSEVGSGTASGSDTGTGSGSGSSEGAPGEGAPGEDVPCEDAPGEDAPGEGAPHQSSSLSSGDGNGCRPRWQSQGGYGWRRTFRSGGRGGRVTEAEHRRAMREAELAAQEEEVEEEDEDAAPVAPAPEDVAIGEHDGLSATEQAEHDALTTKVAQGMADEANARQAEQAQQAATLSGMNRQRAQERRAEIVAAAAAAEAAYPDADRAAAANELAALTAMNSQFAQQQEAHDACAADAAAKETKHIERMQQARVHRIEMTRRRAEAVAAAGAEAANAEDDEDEQAAIREKFQCQKRSEARAYRIIEERRAAGL